MKKIYTPPAGKPSPGFRGGRADRRECVRQNDIERLMKQMHNQRKDETNDK